MRDYSRIRLSNFLINLTGTDIEMYDDVSGTIYDFPACDSDIPETPTKHRIDSPTYHYVVTEDRAKELIESGRPVYDIAVLKSIGTGRDNSKIATLYWATNPEIPVILYKSKFNKGIIYP